MKSHNSRYVNTPPTTAPGTIVTETSRTRTRDTSTLRCSATPQQIPAILRLVTEGRRGHRVCSAPAGERWSKPHFRQKFDSAGKSHWHRVQSMKPSRSIGQGCYIVTALGLSALLEIPDPRCTRDQEFFSTLSTFNLLLAQQQRARVTRNGFRLTIKDSTKLKEQVKVVP